MICLISRPSGRLFFYRRNNYDIPPLGIVYVWPTVQFQGVQERLALWEAMAAVTPR